MKPTTRNLQRYWDEETAMKIRLLIAGTDSPLTYPSVEAWLRQCYHRPPEREQMALALNEILGGSGVEAIRGRYVDSYHLDIQAVYINLGDTYAATLLLDHETDRWIVTSWGDWVEKNEKERELT